VAQKIAARKWGEWFERLEAKRADPKDIAAAAPAAKPAPRKPAKVAAGTAKENDVDQLGKKLERVPADP
jgi:hypothetical protein